MFNIKKAYNKYMFVYNNYKKVKLYSVSKIKRFSSF